GIKRPTDLIGKRIMGTTDELKYSSLALLLEHFYVHENNAVIVEHSFNIDDFVDHRVDVISAFRSNQFFELDERNIEYNVIDPADYGFYMSAVNLFTSREEALLHPQRTQRFIDATNQGWAYALEHSDEIVDLIYERYSKKKSKEALTYEVDVIKDMMLLDFYPVGATNEELSVRALKQLQQSKLLKQGTSLGTFIFEDVIRKLGNTILWSPDERQYLENKSQITMCVDPDWLPFEAIENGKHIGIAAEVFDILRELIPVPINMVETKSWIESIEKGQSRECDIFSLASATPERDGYMDFTSSYVDLPVVMATKTDKYFIENIEQVKDKKIGIVEGYAIAEFLRNSIEGINIVDVSSITEGLKMVESGELYGYVDNLMVIASSIQKQFTGVLKISARLDEKVRLAIGTRNDEPLLNSIFEVAISHIREKEKQAIYNRWVSVKQEMGFDYRLFWKIVAVLILVMLGLAYYYFKLRKYNMMLKQLSISDTLTKLYNRLKIDEILLQQHDAFTRYGSDCGVIMLDIDLFKRVNDNHGHQAGDKVLVEFANLLKKHVRSTDYVGRWGGEEFLIVCPNIGLAETEQVAHKLLTEIRENRFSYGAKMSASFGVSCFQPGLTADKLIEKVDSALYQSKQQGRNKVTAAE
ncbi:MAG: diguanylate cyclase, partial [Gammaproteobacteria bacterium]|nr:diguanylate cyclase [Gammaproteobacteria bacterium]